jgi:hypothetical protein
MASRKEPLPYFHALAVFACKSNRLYRRIALRELPRVLGEVCRVEIEWSERDQKFVKRSG